MGLEVGSIVEGKVTGITKFGAFVALPDRKSGLVHISEIANSFVNDVHDFVQIGQTVRVRVLAVSDDGKVNLSIKRAGEPPERRQTEPERSRPAPAAPAQTAPRAAAAAEAGPADPSFEDRLKRFMQESDSRIADTRRNTDRRQRGRRR
ncbi:MAG: S1 RNA-binding domain-containing protein [Oscillospiraceae bacterium]|nr:S1 RNA-binding domain-containing protein [Oscillospiraceae bacterium]